MEEDPLSPAAFYLLSLWTATDCNASGKIKWKINYAQEKDIVRLEKPLNVTALQS